MKWFISSQMDHSAIWKHIHPPLFTSLLFSLVSVPRTVSHLQKRSSLYHKISLLHLLPCGTPLQSPTPDSTPSPLPKSIHLINCAHNTAFINFKNNKKVHCIFLSVGLIFWLENFPNYTEWLPRHLQFNSVPQSCPTLCDPMNCSTPGLPVYHQLLEFTQTHAHRVGDAIQPSHHLSSPSPPAPNSSQHQGLFQWVIKQLIF